MSGGQMGRGISLREKRKKLNTNFREKLREQRSDDPVQKCLQNTDDCCSENWSKVEKEVDLITNHPDDIERNKQINAAYADLYLNDPKGQKWAGTAAIVSKQVGCTMQNNVFASDTMLGKGNVAIFENIYPALKMYQESIPPMSVDELISCLEKNIGDKKTLDPLLDSIKEMTSGNGDNAAILIAEHEQKEVIEKAMWNSKLVAVGAFLNSKTGEIGVDQSIYFVSDCSKPENRKLGFPYWSNISNPESRVEFYEDLFIPMFDKVNAVEGQMNTIMEGIRKNGATHK